MFGLVLFIIITAGVAYAIRRAWSGRREARAYGQHMRIQYTGHVALYEPRRSSTADFGVAPEPHRSWQYEDHSPSTLDLLYEQMAAQEEAYRRRERERDLGY